MVIVKLTQKTLESLCNDANFDLLWSKDICPSRISLELHVVIQSYPGKGEFQLGMMLGLGKLIIQQI